VGAVAPSTTFTPGGLDVCDVVVVNGFDFADGLSGAVYPDRAVLLTAADALSTATATELARLKVDCAALIAPQVVDMKVIGGETAVSSEVFEDLEGYGDVERHFGANRYKTSLAVAADVCGVSAAAPGAGCAEVMIVTGLKSADALAASGLANDNGQMPIILNDGDTLSADVKAFLAANTSLNMVSIAGGTSAVPAQVETDLVAQLGVGVTRYDGPARAETAVEIAVWAGATPAGVILVNGGDDSFADALAAGPLAGSTGFPILLVNTCSIPAATSAYLEANSATIADILVVGGTAAVCADVVTEAKATATTFGAEIVSATLATSDVKPATYVTAGAAGIVTFTGKTGGSAEGVNGNGWAIELYQTGAASLSFVSPDPATPTDAKSIAISGAITATDDADFVDAFNASPFGADFTASTATTSLMGQGPATIGDTGTIDSKIVVTFDRAVVVNAALPFDVHGGPLPGQPIGSGFINLGNWVSCSATPAAATASLTYTITCDDEDIAATVPNAEIRFDVGAYSDVAGTANAAVVTAKLTNA
jgi:putative cell wall-binding protein